MAEDPFQGDAQFTVSVDGKQIGGVQTTTAVVDDGQFQEFDVHGNFGQGGHQVSIDYLNDAVGGFYPAGTPGLPPGGPWALDTEDRNLYVMGMSLDGGQPTSGAPWEISSDGTATFDVGAGTNPSATAYNSGLFASDGAAATSNNAAIPTGSLAPGVSSGASSSGSSSGMSFVAPSSSAPSSTASSSSTGGTSDPSSSSTGGSTTTASAPAPSVATAASSTGSTPSPQDFSVPSGSSWSGSNQSGSTGGWSGHHWWGNQDTTHVAGSFHQHG
jgi:hypothetical protein